jgi:hypothetical protein
MAEFAGGSSQYYLKPGEEIFRKVYYIIVKYMTIGGCWMSHDDNGILFSFVVVRRCEEIANHRNFLVWKRYSLNASHILCLLFLSTS